MMKEWLGNWVFLQTVSAANAVCRTAGAIRTTGTVSRYFVLVYPATGIYGK